MTEFEKAGASGESMSVESRGVLVETLIANKTLTVGDSGKTFLIGTDALVISLPATVAGLEYTFINSGASGNNIITISPVAADGVGGTLILAATAVVRAGTVNVDLVNTKTTAKPGDSVKITGTGVTGVGAYYITGSTGIWA